MAPNRPQVVSFKAFTVRSGRALPSLHQNSQPMSQGTYSASSFMRSNTMRAASMTSLPTPSPGIHAISYLGIVQFVPSRFSLDQRWNDEIRMTKPETNPNDKEANSRDSDFGINSS